MTMLHLGNDTNMSSLDKYDKEQLQPNAIDLRVKEITKITDTVFKISEDEKVHRKTETINLNEEGYWVLETGSYEIIFEGKIKIGLGEAGFVITRSTLNRNGLFLTSGLYDSGYAGVMAGALHVNGGTALIKPGSRLGQFLLFKAQALHSYSGSYGIHSDHDKEKYKGMVQ